jgi:hypothetical protein
MARIKGWKKIVDFKSFIVYKSKKGNRVYVSNPEIGTSDWTLSSNLKRLGIFKHKYQAFEEAIKFMRRHPNG